MLKVVGDRKNRHGSHQSEQSLMGQEVSAWGAKPDWGIIKSEL